MTAGLLDPLDRLLDRARGSRALVSVTTRVEIDDPSAAVFASRMADDRWFAWEQPDRDGFALAGLGSAHEAISRGAGRFADLVHECTAITRGRLAAEPDGLPAGAGPVWTGGFAFAPDGAASPPWSSFPPALLVLPELSLLRTGGETWLTLSAVTGAGADPASLVARLTRRLVALRGGGLPLLDPAPRGEARITSVTPPGRYEETVAAATERIRAGGLEKVVLGREVAVEAPGAHDSAAVFGALRELFPSCFCFCAGSPEGAFLGASPELLVRRRGAGVATVALAGSTRRSADPAVDDHLGEQLLRSAKDRSEHAIVSRRIERALAPRSVWVEAEAEPALVKVANIQHLATAVHAQLTDPLSAVELAALLHPTPAVGGEPVDPALAAIEELEQMDRGWYAGPVGWMDAAEDGELCVALRSALLRDRTAHLYAGAGIVADSDPAAELAETELKLEALLPLLAG
ncbi:MAG: isochorismate synthase [Solirubrobacterales bacterium]|jgi:salicylate biosynthesis isochorismate synthase/menaquinone-specific isochorismate synthase|nr:isochorismate synthase [Solirubrobacterales bacterium]